MFMLMEIIWASPNFSFGTVMILEKTTKRSSGIYINFHDYQYPIHLFNKLFQMDLSVFTRIIYRNCTAASRIREIHSQIWSLWLVN